MRKSEESPFDIAAREVVELGNRLAEGGDDSHPWDIADGLLAGAVHYWLYTRQPCGDPECEECSPINTAARRLATLLDETRRFAEESEYYHTPNDRDVGRA